MIIFNLVGCIAGCAKLDILFYFFDFFIVSTTNFENLSFRKILKFLEYIM